MSDSDDEDFLPGSDRKRGRSERGRTNYRRRFLEVFHRQGGRHDPKSGDYLYSSVVKKGKINRLDSQKRERVPHHRYPKGKLQRPALDHDIQYANLEEQYDLAIARERRKPRRLRRSSIDLAIAFDGATSDPENLSIKTFSEHKKTGGSFRRGQFPATRQRRAATLLEEHYSRIPSKHTQAESEASVWDRSRPKWTVQKPTSPSSGSSQRFSIRQKKRRRIAANLLK